MTPLLLALALALPADHKPAPAVKAAYCASFAMAPRVWRPYGAYMREWCAR